MYKLKIYQNKNLLIDIYFEPLTCAGLPKIKSYVYGNETLHFCTGKVIIKYEDIPAHYGKIATITTDERRVFEDCILYRGKKIRLTKTIYCYGVRDIRSKVYQEIYNDFNNEERN